MTTQLAPGGRSSQRVFLSTRTNVGQPISTSLGQYEIAFDIPEKPACILARDGLRIRGTVQCSYKVAPTVGNHVYLSPAAGLHSMIQSTVVSTASNQVIERIKEYRSLVAAIKTLTSRPYDGCSVSDSEDFIIGTRADLSSYGDNNSMLWSNEIGNLNGRMFCFQLQTGMSLGNQDIDMQNMGGIKIQLMLDREFGFLLSPGASSDTVAAQNIANVNFSLTDVQLVYTEVYKATPINAVPDQGSVLPGSTLMSAMDSPGTQVYTTWYDQRGNAFANINTISLAFAAPAASVLLWTFDSQGTPRAMADPNTLDRFQQDNILVTIGGERTSFFNPLSGFDLLIETMRAFTPMCISDEYVSIDPRYGISAVSLDVLTAGPNLEGANRLIVQYKLTQIEKNQPIAVGTLESQQTWNGAKLNADFVPAVASTAKTPANVHFFALGARAIPYSNVTFGRSAMM